MRTIGIICEYNPFHRGHEKQIRRLKSSFPEAGIVCLMSGNFVQRGAPALLDQSLRAEAALDSGADLILQMPITGSLSSAEGFADRGVEILGKFCDGLCFGTESGGEESLMATAKALLNPAFSGELKDALSTGVSFPKARQIALGKMGFSADLLEKPNDILAVEYCKAILRRSLRMEILPIHRAGDYHDPEGDREHPSATAVRAGMLAGGDWEELVPPWAAERFRDAPLHRLENGEKAILYRLRTMTEAEFSLLPFGSEGLWRKLMHASRRETTLEGIIAGVKSKRYTHTRISRMILCAFLGITGEMLAAPVPYARVLGAGEKGRGILKTARETGEFLNIGAPAPFCPYGELEERAELLYGLFSSSPQPLPKRRVIIK